MAESKSGVPEYGCAAAGAVNYFFFASSKNFLNSSAE